MTDADLGLQLYLSSPAVLALDDAQIFVDSWGDPYPWPINSVLNYLEGVYNDLKSILWDNVVVYVRDLYTTVVAPIQSTVTSFSVWIWNQINSITNSLINNVGNSVTSLHTYVTSFWTWVTANLGSLQGAVAGIGGTVWSFILDLWSWTGTAIGNLANSIIGWLNNLWAWTSGAFGSLASSVWSDVLWVNDRLWEGAGWVAQKVWDNVQWLWNAYMDTYRAVVGLIHDQYGGLHDLTIAKIDDLWSKIQADLIDPLGDWLSRLFDLWTSEWEWLKDKLSRFWQQLQLSLIQLWNSDLVQGVIAGAGQIVQLVGGLLNQAQAAIWRLITTRAPVSPEGAPDAINSALSTVGTLAATLAGAKIAGQLILPHVTGWDRAITEAIKEMSDFSEVNNRWIRPAFDSWIGLPTYYYFNNVFKPRLPSPAELAGMVGEGVITPEKYVETIGYHGIGADWAHDMIELSYRPVPLFRLADISGYITSDPDWVARELRKASYRPETQQLLIQYTHAVSVQKGSDRGLSALMSLYSDGYLSDAQLQAELEGAGYPPTVSIGILTAGRWMYTQKLHADLLAELSAKYSKDLLSEGDLRGVLSGLGWSGDRVDIYVTTQNVKKVPTPKRVAAAPPKPLYEQPSGVLEIHRLTLAYENSLVDRGTFTGSLARLEMPADLVNAYADLSDARKQVATLRGQKPPTPAYDTDSGRLNVRTLVLLYSKKQLAQSDLAAGLSGLEMPADLVAATVANAVADAIQRPAAGELDIPIFQANTPEAILLADSRAAFRRREISGDQLGATLVNLGYAPDDARKIVDAESLVRDAAPVVKPEFVTPYAAHSPQALLYANALSAYRQGSIDDVALHDILIRLGYDEGQAAQIIAAEQLVRPVAVEVVPPVVPPWPARSPEAILWANSRRAYLAGTLSDQEFHDILIYLGYTDVQATQILSAEQLVKKAPAVAAV